jgi:hypothetical protein
LLAERPDLVILSMSPNHKLPKTSVTDSQAPIGHGVVRVARKLVGAGIPFATIQHTPWQLHDVPTCLSTAGGTVSKCSGARDKVRRDGALRVAARTYEEIKVLDLEDVLCVGEVCPVVIGNVLVYRDFHHLTATYARTLAPALADRLGQVLPALR